LARQIAVTFPLFRRDARQCSVGLDNLLAHPGHRLTRARPPCILPEPRLDQRRLVPGKPEREPDIALGKLVERRIGCREGQVEADIATAGASTREQESGNGRPARRTPHAVEHGRIFARTS
jgi:hypothetical protein